MISDAMKSVLVGTVSTISTIGSSFKLFILKVGVKEWIENGTT
jgi:hypothetical protein